MKQIIAVGMGIAAILLLIIPVILYDATERVVETQIPVSLLFVGDIMFDRDVARHARLAGEEALFAGVSEILLAHDVVVGNLEGTITGNPSVVQVDNTVLRFTFEPQFAQVLRGAGLTVVSLANNHALDFGEFGFEDTLHHLTEAGLTAFGSPYNEQKLAVQTTLHGKDFCFIGYHELFNRDPSAVVEKIKEIESRCDYTVVFAHWGEEYSQEPTASQRELARLFVDNGADLIIGAHPHVVQPVEIYNNVAIFYSLGNFIFDQGWRSEVKRGLMVSVELEGNMQRFTLIPVNTYLEASLADEVTTQAVLDDLGVDSPTFELAQ
jgi:poly-gamma-glutamate synthesis protein (capsule biosynthesis protein)